MKADLDRLMEARGLAAIIVPIGEDYCPVLDYLAGRVHVTWGLAVKKTGEPPFLVVNGMEVEEAAVSGLTVYTATDLGWADLIQAAAGDGSRAMVSLWERALVTASLESGRVGIYGTGELHTMLDMVGRLEDTLPAYTFFGETGMTLFAEAAITKDAGELTRIRSVAVRTNEVLTATWEYIARHRADGETVVDASGTPLTIGAVRRFIRRALLDRELEDTGMIFAQGRDAGFPHSRGQDSMLLQRGQTIVFDLFPRELGGGYHHDVTRTWCIDYAPDEVQTVYTHVMDALDKAIEAFGVGKPTSLAQEAVLDHFEMLGHPTTRSNPTTAEGYVHSLGHGVGLQIHERPMMSHLNKRDVFQVGNVITIEPGLYYPDRGYGIRVEDTFLVDDGGALVSLTRFRKDLVLPLREQ